jgi:carbon monoxide dehydrogenase subunit G
MSDISNYESRSGRLTCNAEDVFAFVTDLRNFERFLPEGTINNWSAEREACSFNVSMVGTVTVRLAEKEQNTRVVYMGDALMKNDFTLTLFISDNAENAADVKVKLDAELNPMMKMMAAKPIRQFLEMLINEMEKFADWKNTKV